MRRVGIDIGGTFTDLVEYDEATRRIVTTKTPTTPRSPEHGVLAAWERHAFAPGDLTQLLHATTLVTNLVISRTGGLVGLITTRGFEDTLGMGSGTRAEVYNLEWLRPDPLVPRRRIIGVTERMSASGGILCPIDRDDVARAVTRLVLDGVESVAVCLFNSYANAEHERIVAEIVECMAPDLHVSLSSDVDPRIREYPRVSTTTINAYAMPRVSRYIKTLDDAMKLPEGVKYMHSGGGLVSSSVAQKLPVLLAMSGPAAGVIAAKHLGRVLGIDNIITGDMGGTSFDVCVINDGKAMVRESSEIEPTVPLRSESIDIVSIGAGGGSIAWIDEGGAVRVGPRSAGGDPGPACYDRGGTEPTVTDANMVLGLLNPDGLLGGRLPLVTEKSRAAIETIARALGTTPEQAAAGIFQIVNSNMAQAIHQITVQKGIDPREFCFIAFGGAGGQHAIEVAQELEIPSVLFPANGSALSAFGLLTADHRYTASKTVLMSVSSIAAGTWSAWLLELAGRARALLDSESVHAVEIGYSVDARYEGQSYELRVDVGEGTKPHEIGAIFENVYKSRYGLTLGDPVEILNAHATIVGLTHPPDLPVTEVEDPRRRATPARETVIPLYDIAVPVFRRRDLGNGMRVSGPSIVEEENSSILIPSGWDAEADRFGNIMARVAKQTVPAQPGSGTSFDPFAAEIMRSYFVSTVREMVLTTTGTAYSTCFAEGGDFTCGIFDAEGRMIAQALGIPAHAGGLGDVMRTILRRFDSFKEGDAIIMNDPFEGGSHQPDGVLVRPILDNGRLMAFAVNRGHWTDIGGMAAGGWSGNARHVVQEALIIPAVKLYDGGVLNREVQEFILKNVRLPKQLWGDIQSQISSNITAERRLRELVRKHGRPMVDQGMEYSRNYSRTRFEAMLEQMPDGEGEAEDFLDDDGFGSRPYKIHVVLKKQGKRIAVDFTGTDKQAVGPINCTIAGSKGRIYSAIFAIVDPDFSMSEGAIDVVELNVPKGTIMNAQYPAPVASWYGIGARIAEVIVKAFASIVPDRATSASFGDSQNVSGWGYSAETGEEFIWYTFSPGGLWATTRHDGGFGYHLSGGGARLESMEAWERRYPVFFESFRFLRDTGGPGRNRGGLGTRRELRVLADTLLNANCDRQIVPPWGIFGGMPGAVNRLAVIRDGTEYSVKELFRTTSSGRFANVQLKVGDVFVIEMGGGGGLGDPLEREPERVRTDVLTGSVSLDAARTQYGVALDPETLAVDVAVTAELRTAYVGAR